MKLTRAQIEQIFHPTATLATAQGIILSGLMDKKFRVRPARLPKVSPVDKLKGGVQDIFRRNPHALIEAIKFARGATSNNPALCASLATAYGYNTANGLGLAEGKHFVESVRDAMKDKAEIVSDNLKKLISGIAVPHGHSLLVARVKAVRDWARQNVLDANTIFAKFGLELGTLRDAKAFVERL